jgi:hypothetical protein
MANDLDTILTTINSEVSQVKEGVDKVIETEGLDNDQIERWINYLTQIIRKVDHVIETLEESKTG